MNEVATTGISPGALTRWQEMTADIGEGVKAHPARVGLSFFALAVGIAALTVLAAVLEGLREKSRMLVRELGADVLAVAAMPGDGKTGNRGLSERHLPYLRNTLQDCRVSGMRRYELPGQKAGSATVVLATDEHLCAVRQWTMQGGRFLDARDMLLRERHAVVSAGFARAFATGLGSTIMIRDTPFTVVGIVDVGGAETAGGLADMGIEIGEQAIFVPVTVAPGWVAEAGKPEPVLDAIFIRANGESGLRRTLAKTRRLMEQPDYRVEGLSWILPESLLARIRKLQAMVGMTAGSVALLCLILGGTTLMSLMTADVRHRTGEIGLRCALGASRKDIAQLFVSEAVIVSLAAGVTGAGAMVLLLAAAERVSSLPVKLTPVGLLAPILMAVLLGAAFSWWPASLAARLAPSEALRND